MSMWERTNKSGLIENEYQMNAVTRPGSIHYDIKEIRSSYAKLLHTYNEFALKKTSKQWWDAFLRKLPKVSRILDLGCGSGVAARYFTGQKMKVVGVDISKEMLSLAKEQAPDASFICADMETVDFPTQSFHGISAFFSFLHLPKEQVIQILYRSRAWLVEERGVMAIAVVEGTDEGLCEDFMGKGVRAYLSYFQKEEMKYMLSDAGFDVTSIDAVQISEKGFEETELFFLAEIP